MEKILGMIDVGEKDITRRTAKASGRIKLPQSVIDRIKKNNIPKGDVLEISRIAGIMAAKKTSDTLPLCHNISLDSVQLDFKVRKNYIEIYSNVRASGKTGVEMEALQAVSVAALTIYDMCKMFTKSMDITDIYLIEKRGGKSGIYKKKSG